MAPLPQYSECVSFRRLVTVNLKSSPPGEQLNACAVRLLLHTNADPTQPSGKPITLANSSNGTHQDRLEAVIWVRHDVMRRLDSAGRLPQRDRLRVRGDGCQVLSESTADKQLSVAFSAAYSRTVIRTACVNN